MSGEFRGDFTRDSFELKKHYSRVMMQQGRVMLDSEFNELQQILTHQLRMLAKTLIGDHGGPGESFKIVKAGSEKYEFGIMPGSYYVDGILCENDVGNQDNLKYSMQDGAEDLSQFLEDYNGNVLVYLDVWDRSISRIQDESIAERALNGVETATRSKVEWVVRVAKDTKKPDITCMDLYDDKGSPRYVLAELIDSGKVKGRLKAQIKKVVEEQDPCRIYSNSKSRGLRNLLYRVEIHRSGIAYDSSQMAPDPKSLATFKWSRMNGSVDFAIENIKNLPQSTDDDQILTVVLKLEPFKDKDFRLEKGDWVEILNDRSVLKRKTFPLWQVQEIDDKNVSLKRDNLANIDSDEFENKSLLLRRWDHRGESVGSKNAEFKLSEGAVLIEEGKDFNLENDIQITFWKEGVKYNSGDYWVIPARQASAGIEWPNEEYLPPHGIWHHIAPLAIISIKGIILTPSCRRIIDLSQHIMLSTT